MRYSALIREDTREIPRLAYRVITSEVAKRILSAIENATGDEDVDGTHRYRIVWMVHETFGVILAPILWRERN